MKLTMKDIARLANVSQPTVSRVINGNPNVDKALAKRVMKVIEESNFTVNRAAQTLKSSQSFLVGVCVTDLSNPYFMEVIQAMEQDAREAGYNIIIHNSMHNPIKEWENVQNFLSRQVDGILLVPFGDYNIEKLKQLNVPIVITTQIKEDFDSVSVCHKEGVKLVADHLVSQGHQKIGYIGPPNDEKLIFFKKALYNNGIPFNDKRIIPLTPGQESAFDIHQNIESYLSEHSSFDMSAIFCYNDVTALEFMRLTSHENSHVPENIAVVGFDDSLISKIFEISSIHQPIEEMTKTAFKLLLSRIKDNSKETTSIELPPKLIVRKSST